MDEKDRTLWAGNLSERVTEELLYELFLQAGPLQKVKIPKKDGQSFKVSYAFITFKHAVSVPYSIQLLDGIHLHGKPLKLQSRTGSVHQNPQNVELQRQMSGSSLRHHYGNDPSPSAMQRSTSRQGSYDRDRSRSHDRGHDRGSGSRDQNGGRDLSVISLSGQFSTNSPRPRDMDPLQTRRERILHNQAASLEIHRHRNDRHRAPNPYDRDPRQPWHQSSYRR